MKRLWQFYYRPLPTSNQAKMLIYAANYEAAVEIVKEILRRDYGRTGGILIMQGDKYRHDSFDNITDANNQLGPSRTIMTSLPPSQMLEFLQDYTQAMSEKERQQRTMGLSLLRGEKDMLRHMKALLRLKQVEAQAENGRMKSVGVGDAACNPSHRIKEHLGKATAEVERVHDVSRDW